MPNETIEPAEVQTLVEENFEPVAEIDQSDTPEGHRSGFVAIIGQPNVGKSTLLNYLLGQKVAIVSHLPQTTRNRTLGILNLPDPDLPYLAHLPPCQMIIIDTPGIHKAHHKLGRVLNDTATEGMLEADVILWLVDATRKPDAADQLVVEQIDLLKKERKFAGTLVLGLNKIDVLLKNTPAKQAEQKIEQAAQPYTDLLMPDLWLPFSALKGENLTPLIETVVKALPKGPRFYPLDQITDQHLRFIAAEMIREACLYLLRDEVPHAIAIEVLAFKERSATMTYISANIIVEREPHKKIVIGHKGAQLKKIGQRARREIENLMQTQVYLELWVKVRPKWRNKQNELQRLGYAV